jgi:pimeloyl-ACP methyl ester carboxylesterase
MALLALIGAGRASAFGKQDNLPLPMSDGVVLKGTLYTPDAPGIYPAVIMFHGLGGKRQDLDAIASRFASNFVVLTVDMRGHGQSEGLVSVDGPREIQDVREIYGWLAAQPEVRANDIGGWGISLGGGAVLRSLVEGVPWAAVETVETWTDLFSALAPQNLSKSGAIYQLLNSVPPERLDPSVKAIEQDAIASRNLPALHAFADARSSRPLLSQVHTPILMAQGRRDFAFDIDQAAAGYRLLKGPKQLLIGDFGHSPSTFPGPDYNAVVGADMSWFIRWLQHTQLRPYSPIALSPDPWRGKLRAYKKLPSTLAAHISFGGTNTVTGVAKAVRSTGRTHARLETFGAGRLRLTARLSGGWERLVAVLTARTPKHKTIVVSEGGVNTSGLSGRRKLTVNLISDATLIPSGSRLTLTLASSSMAQDPGNLLYLDLPQPSGAKVVLGPARLDLPVLRKPVSR